MSQSFSSHAFAFWLVLSIAMTAGLAWVATVQVRVRRMQARVDDVLGGLTSDNSARMLTEYLTTVRATAAAVNHVKQQQDEIVHLMPSVIRHVGLVRFSPFHDTGGDQSFALAVLDGRGNGVVLTALHSRNDSRLYAKPIEHRSSRYSLTPEERQAMQHAVDQEGIGQVS